MIDLHTHSTYSDGTVTPTELVKLAKQAGLTALALCDHNTVNGLPEFLDAAQQQGVESIPGVELSTEYEGTELHILALFLRPEHYSIVTELLNDMLAEKERSNRALISRLASAGIHLNYDTLKSSNPGGLINRAVIAAEMVRQGYALSVKEAFSRWLSEKHGYYQPPRRLDSLAAIRLIRSMGCVSVLAHPFLDLDEAGLRRFLSKAVEAGLDAMETHYSEFDDATTLLAKQISHEFGLLESGGSDYHGTNKPHIHLGCGKGSLSVPEEFLDKLRKRSALAGKTAKN